MANTSATNEIYVSDAIRKVRRLWKFLLSKWIIICMFVLAGGIAGVIYAWQQDMKYEARLTFSTEEDNGGAGGGILGLAAQFGFDLGSVGGVYSGDNILSLVGSQKIIGASLLSHTTVDGKDQLLLNRYMEASRLTEKIRKVDSLKNFSFPAGQDPKTYSRLQDSVLLLAIDDIGKNDLKIYRPDTKVDIYEIDCITTDEIFSKEFTLELIKQVTDSYVETKTKRAQQTVDVLQKRADSIRGAYNTALYGKASLTDANLNAALQVPVVNIQKEQTDITVLGTAYAEIIKDLELAKFNLLRATPLIQVIDEPIYPLKQIKLGRLLGGIIFGFVAGLITVFYLSIKYIYRKIAS